MKRFVSALQFLTIVRIDPKNTARDLGASVVYFPVVGLFLGLALAILNSFMSALHINSLVIDIILVIALIVMTGGLHLDGVADTTDALFSSRPRQEMLAIMRDPHIGTMGVLGLVSVLLLKIALLSSIAMPLKASALILMCVFGRWSAVLSIFAFPYAREDGKAYVFMKDKKVSGLLIATAIALIIGACVFGWQGLTIAAIIAVVTYLAGGAITEKIGGVTGDTIGAVLELSEIAALASVCIWTNVGL